MSNNRCESCKVFDHDACEFGGIDGFCCCADLCLGCGKDPCQCAAEIAKAGMNDCGQRRKRKQETDPAEC